MSIDFAERERQKLDTILVANLEEQPYTLLLRNEQDPTRKLKFVIPAKDEDHPSDRCGKGRAMLPRYAAEIYVKERVDNEILKMGMDKVKKENQKREESGKDPLTKYPGENSRENILSQYQLADVELRKMLSKKYLLGVVREYAVYEEPHEKANIERDFDPFADLDTIDLDAGSEVKRGRPAKVEAVNDYGKKLQG